MFRRGTLLLTFATCGCMLAHAQQPTPEVPAPKSPATAEPAQSARPPDASQTNSQGKVLFSRGQPTDAAEPDGTGGAGQAMAGQASAGLAAGLAAGPADVLPQPVVMDAERAAVRITAYDLDVHLQPSDSGEAVQARVTVRNVSGGPVARIPLQLSSTLRFQQVSATMQGRGLQPVPFTESPVATDADHTGYAEEAVIVPAAPLAPGASLTLIILYAGSIAQSSARLDLLGVAPEKAAATDWDRIAPTSDESATALRGFGNVLWYPVASSLALLGDGNRLFALAGEQRLANQAATIHMRLTVEYAGDPPEAAIFNGDLQPLAKVADGQDLVVDQTRGVATADFGERPLGFRLPSLFLTAQKAQLSEGATLAVVTPNPESVAPYREAAGRVQTLVGDWFGVSPLEPLTLLDHAGQPFEDESLLVGQLAANAEVDATARVFVGPITHAWFNSGHPWISEGLAEFMRLLWTEREAGRAAAIAQLTAEEQTVALAEPAQVSMARTDGTVPQNVHELTAQQAGQALVQTGSDIFCRNKAAAVWWQLREILGEQVLAQGLQAYRHSEALSSAFDADPKAMQRTLEKVAGKDLSWFFVDWVYRDSGLPELSIVQVNARPLPSRAGKEGGYLVVVEVRNAGGAVAEVPVTVSSGTGLTATERLRVAAGEMAAVRIVFQGTPETVKVNDGSVPEIGPTEHTFLVKTVE